MVQCLWYSLFLFKQVSRHNQIGFFSKQIIDSKKTIEEKETYLVKMRIQCHPFVSFLFIPIADFSLFVANQTKVESKHSMNVFKPRKRESRTLMCVRVCVRVIVSVRVLVCYIFCLFLLVCLFLFVWLFLFVSVCLFCLLYQIVLGCKKKWMR